MVDINLLKSEGEEEPTPKKEEKAPEELIEEDEEEGYLYRKKGKRGLVIALIGCLVILALAYLFLRPKGKQPIKVPPSIEVVEREKRPESVEPTQEGVSPISGEAVSLLQDKINYTVTGVLVVKGIMKVIPKDIGLSLMSYSHGSFFIESLAGSDAEAIAFDSNLRKNLTQASIKLLSKDEKLWGERLVKRVLFSGEVKGVTPRVRVREIRYNDCDSVVKNIRRVCSAKGLLIKSINVKERVESGPLKWVPVSLKVFGNRDSAVQLLEEITQNNQNLCFSRILITSADQGSLSSKMIRLVLDMDVYLPI